MKKFMLILIIIVLIITNCVYADIIGDHSKYEELVKNKIQEYKGSGINYKARLADYDVHGDYFYYGLTSNYRNTDIMQLDSDGIPKVKHGGEFFYNPVTVSQYGLTVYGRYINGKDTLENFIKVADKLIEMQDSDGAFRYPFAFKYYLTDKYMESGWVSGMAQGQAISVLTRAYYMTSDMKYLESAKRSLDFLITPINQGGTMGTLKDLAPLLEDYIIFEEYIAEPNSYTLNGFMFTLIGLYDYTQIDNAKYDDSIKMAKEYFFKGLNTLKKILPLYDIGGITTYDLGYITYDKKPLVNISYHAVHIQLLHGLYSITLDDYFHEYSLKWASYVEFNE